MATLRLLSGPDSGKQFPLGREAVIGRQPDCAVYLESLAVSRKPARIFLHEGQFFLEDLGSSNGTFLNGQRLQRPAPLTARDVFQIGPHAFMLCPDTAPVEADAVMAPRSGPGPSVRTAATPWTWPSRARSCRPSRACGVAAPASTTPASASTWSS